MIVVLDYNDGKVYLYNEPDYTPEPKSISDVADGMIYKSEQIEAMIEDEGHQLSNCNWMQTCDRFINRSKLRIDEVL